MLVVQLQHQVHDVFHIRVGLFGQVAGQVAQLGADLHQRLGDEDALVALFLQHHFQRAAKGQEGLALARRGLQADQRDVRVQHQAHGQRLVHVARHDVPRGGGELDFLRVQRVVVEHRVRPFPGEAVGHHVGGRDEAGVALRFRAEGDGAAVFLAAQAGTGVGHDAQQPVVGDEHHRLLARHGGQQRAGVGDDVLVGRGFDLGCGRGQGQGLVVAGDHPQVPPGDGGLHGGHGAGHQMGLGGLVLQLVQFLQHRLGKVAGVLVVAAQLLDAAGVFQQDVGVDDVMLADFSAGGARGGLATPRYGGHGGHGGCGGLAGGLAVWLACGARRGAGGVPDVGVVDLSVFLEILQ